MATEFLNMREIKKLIKMHLVPEMASRGFEYSAKSKMFYRLDDNEIYKVIGVDRTGAGYIEFIAFCWVSEATERDMSEFPFTLTWDNGGAIRVSENKTSEWCAGTSFGFIDEASFIEKIQYLLREIDNVTIPWFESVVTRKDYLDVVELHFREYDWWQDYERNVLAGGKLSQ